MIHPSDIHKIQAYIFMQRFYAYLLALRYFCALKEVTDAISRLTYINDSISGPIEYVYGNTGCAVCGGALDKVIQEITPLGSINYEYDAIGRRTTMQVAGQEAVAYQYDSNSRLIQINQGTQAVSIAYDSVGKRTSLILPNGIIATYNYDNANHLTNITYSFNSQILKSLNYSYDANSSRTSFSGHNTLLPATMTASYNQANQMITYNAENLTYDANGNLTSKGDTTYTWDVRNRLIGITSPSMTASFKYDSFGRRIEKTINGKTTSYLYDEWDIVQEIENGMVTTNYLRSRNIDETLGILRQEGSYYYIYDALGSTFALTDSLGNIAAEYYYDPFGNTQTSNPSIYNPFQYMGRENDNTGLIYYRLRYKLGERFISEDPIGLRGGINKFSYTANNPINRIDPFGLEAWIDLGRTGDGSKIYQHIRDDGSSEIVYEPPSSLYPSDEASCKALQIGCTIDCSLLIKKPTGCRVFCTTVIGLVCPEKCE